jgi:hypothetical protein
MSLPGNKKRCPYCDELIPISAKICRFCQEELPQEEGSEQSEKEASPFDAPKPAASANPPGYKYLWDDEESTPYKLLDDDPTKAAEEPKKRQSLDAGAKKPNRPVPPAKGAKAKRSEEEDEAEEVEEMEAVEEDEDDESPPQVLHLPAEDKPKAAPPVRKGPPPVPQGNKARAAPTPPQRPGPRPSGDKPTAPGGDKLRAAPPPPKNLPAGSVADKLKAAPPAPKRPAPAAKGAPVRQDSPPSKRRPPQEEVDELGLVDEVELVEEVTAVPPKPKRRPPADEIEEVEVVEEADEDFEEERPRRRGRPADDEEEDEDERPRRKRRSVRRSGGFAPCPHCGSRSAARIWYTFWGAWLGPLLLCHVRCNRCNTTYNGRTGNSNTTAIIIYVAITYGLGLALGLLFFLIRVALG